MRARPNGVALSIIAATLELTAFSDAWARFNWYEVRGGVGASGPAASGGAVAYTNSEGVHRMILPYFLEGIVARVGDPAPSGTFTSLGPAHASDTSTAIYATYDSPSKTGIVTTSGAAFVAIAELGGVLPSSSSAIEYFGGFAVSGDTVAFGTTLADGTRGVFASNGDQLTTIAQTGDMTSIGPLANINTAPAISGHTVAFAATTEDGTKGIFTGSGGPLTTVFKVGDPAPVGVFTSFDEGVTIGTGGKVTFSASYDENRQSAIFTSDGQELTTVAKVGDVVPGLGAITSLGGPSMGGDEVAFFASVPGGDGFFVRKGTEPIQRIASTYELFRGSPTYFIHMGRFGFSGNRLTFTFVQPVHYGSYIGILGVRAVPEPATLAMLALVVVGKCVTHRKLHGLWR
jgi:hypothetical protein